MDANEQVQRLNQELLEAQAEIQKLKQATAARGKKPVKHRMQIWEEMNSDPDNLQAYPEAIRNPYTPLESNAWEVIADAKNPRVGIVDGKLYVPSGNTDSAIAIRMHELVHIACTPRGDKYASMGFPEVVAQATENCIVWPEVYRRIGSLYGRAAAARIRKARVAEVVSQTQSPKRSFVSVGMLAPMFLGTSHADALYKLVQRKLKQFEHVAGWDTLSAYLSSFWGDVRYYARRTRPAHDRATLANSVNDYLKVLEMIDDVCLPDLKKPGHADKPTDDPNAQGTPNKGNGDTKAEFTVDPSEHEPPIEYLEPHLPCKTDWLSKNKRIVRMASGSKLVNPVAAKLGNSAMGRKRRRASRRESTAVMLDYSGSMSCYYHLLPKIAEKYANGIVAGYAGSGEDAMIKVVAKNGYYLTDSKCRLPYGGNACDYSALLWLAKQPVSNRIWVTDLGCHGINCDAIAYTRECIKFARANNIKVVERPSALLGDYK